MGKLILVRHGKTVLNSLDQTERLRGWMDIPLDEQGLREAEQTARRLAQYPVAYLLLRPLPCAADSRCSGASHPRTNHTHAESAPMESGHFGRTAGAGYSAHTRTVEA